MVLRYTRWPQEFWAKQFKVIGIYWRHPWERGWTTTLRTWNFQNKGFDMIRLTVKKKHNTARSLAFKVAHPKAKTYATCSGDMVVPGFGLAWQPQSSFSHTTTRNNMHKSAKFSGWVSRDLYLNQVAPLGLGACVATSGDPATSKILQRRFCHHLARMSNHVDFSWSESGSMEETSPITNAVCALMSLIVEAPHSWETKCTPSFGKRRDGNFLRSIRVNSTTVAKLTLDG